MSIDTRAADAVIARLGRGQHGVMHRGQLLDEDLSPRQIGHRVQTGRLIELGHHVYALPSAPATNLRQYKAAELAIPDAAICSLAASVLHDVGAVRSAKPEVAVHPSSNHRCAFARVHRRRDIEVTTVRGIRVTTVAQTLVDITRRVRLDRLEACWSSALARKVTTVEEIADRVALTEAQRLGHRGLARATLDSLVQGAELAESELEALLLRILDDAPDLPAVVPQHPLEFWAGGRGRADAGIPAWRLLLEVDGRSWHARLRDFDRDRERDNLAVANGWIVLRFTALHLRHDPQRVVELIRRTGVQRAA